MTVLCRACSPCAAVCRAVLFGGVCSLGLVRLVVVVLLPPDRPARPSPWCFVVFFVPAAPFLFFCLFLFPVVPCTPLWCGPLCCVCAAVLCHASVLVSCCSVQWLVAWAHCLLSCVVACCAVVFFWPCAVPVCRAVWCGAALCCCPLCVVSCCAGPFFCPGVCCIAGLHPAVLWCCLLLSVDVFRCAASLGAVPCRFTVV